MTSPDQFSTGKTYSPSTVHRLQQESKESAALQAHAGTKALMDAAGNSFFLNILSGFFSIGEAIGDFLGSLGDALFGRYNGGHPTLEAIESWQAENTGNWGPVIEDYGNQLEQKVEAWAVPTVSGLYQTINRQGDPSWPLSALLTPAMQAAYTDIEGGEFYSPVYNKTIPDGDITRSMAPGGDTKGRIYYAFITPAINRAYSRLNFMVGNVVDPCPMDVAIFIVDADKNFTQQLRVSNVSGIGIGESIATVEFDTWVATQGSYIAVAWLQRGTGNTRPLLGLHDTARPLSSGIFPRRLSAQSVSTSNTSIPLTVDGSNGSLVDFTTNWFAPYAELSEDIGDTYTHVTDNFNRNNYLRRPWVRLTGQAPWMDGSSVGVLQAFVVFNGPRVALYDQPMLSEKVHAEVQMTGPLGPQGVSWFAVRTTNTFLDGAGVFITNGTISLRRWSGASNADAIRGAATTIISVNHALQPWDLITCDYDNGTFKVDLNGSTIITSPGHSYGIQFRFMGIGFDRISGDSPPRMAQWRAWDVVEGESE